eukprot:668936-Amphidinium_carterae.2
MELSTTCNSNPWSQGLMQGVDQFLKDNCSVWLARFADSNIPCVCSEVQFSLSLVGSCEGQTLQLRPW